MDVLVSFFAWALVIVLYFVPSIAAKGHHNFGAIFTLNLFLGWTLVGWVVALVWAVSNSQPGPQSYAVAPQAPAAPPGWFPDPDTRSGFRSRYWDGRVWTDHVDGPIDAQAPPSAPPPPNA